MNNRKFALTVILSVLFSIVSILFLVCSPARAQAPAGKPVYRVEGASNPSDAERILNQMDNAGYTFAGSATHGAAPTAFLIFKSK